MNRREFLLAGAGVAVALLATDAVSAPDAPRMKHLYSNYDGELVAANTLEDAARHHDCELGGADDPAWDEWYQVADAARIPVHHEDENETETKTAAEWAAEFAEPCVAATTYW